MHVSVLLFYTMLSFDWTGTTWLWSALRMGYRGHLNILIWTVLCYILNQHYDGMKEMSRQICQPSPQTHINIIFLATLHTLWNRFSCTWHEMDCLVHDIFFNKVFIHVGIDFLLHDDRMLDSSGQDRCHICLILPWITRNFVLRSGRAPSVQITR